MTVTRKEGGDYESTMALLMTLFPEGGHCSTLLLEVLFCIEDLYADLPVLVLAVRMCVPHRQRMDSAVLIKTNAHWLFALRLRVPTIVIVVVISMKRTVGLIETSPVSHW